MRTIPAAIAAFATAVAAGSAAAAEHIWSTGFETGYFETIGPFTYSLLQVDLGGGSLTPSEGLPGFGAQYFRNDTGGTTQFQALGLGGHNDLHLSFDLAFIDSWDGLDGTITPDILFLTVDGADYLQLTSNNASGSAPDYGPGVLTAQGGFAQNPSWSDAVVHFDLVIPHTADDFTFGIRFGGAGFQGGFDESWGIDNFSLSATPLHGDPPIPEPGTWILMIAGFGLAGTALRRRRVLA